MKKSLLALLIVAPLSLGLSGCVISVHDGENGDGISTDFTDRSFKNRKQISTIQLGSSFADIQDKLGVADFSEVYMNTDNTIRVLYYRTQRKHKDGLTTKDECTYLHFVNGELLETGNGGDYSRNIKN